MRICPDINTALIPVGFHHLPPSSLSSRPLPQSVFISQPQHTSTIPIPWELIECTVWSRQRFYCYTFVVHTVWSRHATVPMFLIGYIQSVPWQPFHCNILVVQSDPDSYSNVTHLFSMCSLIRVFFCNSLDSLIRTIQSAVGQKFWIGMNLVSCRCQFKEQTCPSIVSRDENRCWKTSFVVFIKLCRETSENGWMNTIKGLWQIHVKSERTKWRKTEMTL